MAFRYIQQRLFKVLHALGHHLRTVLKIKTVRSVSVHRSLRLKRRQLEAITEDPPPPGETEANYAKNSFDLLGVPAAWTVFTC
eukprot:171230-Pelagomonas_calceolata.AAC.5